MWRAGPEGAGRLATRLATIFTPPHKARVHLAGYNPRGYVALNAAVDPGGPGPGRNLFVGERCVIHRSDPSGEIELGDRVHLYADVVLEAGQEGRIEIGGETHIQPGCTLMAYKGSIRIGARVEIASGCAFYPYNHGMARDRPIREQPLESKGDTVVGDDAWLGFGVIVLDGVTIGRGAVIGAGSVVTRDVPEDAIAFGVPARVVGRRPDGGAV